MNKHESIFYRFRPRNLVRTAIKMVPKSQRYHLYRSLVRFPEDELEGVTFKIAHRKEELESAFELLHDSYVRTGFMQPDPSGLRVTKYHALPSTTTIVAIKDKQVIATITVIRDGPFGFPSDSIIDTSHLRTHGARIAEISALAVHRDYRQTRGAILWPLLAYMYRYSVHLFGIDHLIIAVHPTHYEFYEALLFFTNLLQKPVDSYGFANNNPAMCGFLNLRQVYKQFSAHYGRLPRNRNMFHFFVERDFESMRFPKRENFKISDPFLTPELLDYFFRTRTKAFESLTEIEVDILHGLYPDPLYRAVLPPSSKVGQEVVTPRNANRHDVRCKGRIVLSKDRILKLDINNVSKWGFQASVSQDLRFGAPVKANIAVAEFEIADVLCHPVWRNEHKTYGFHILEADQAWHDFIDALNQDLEQKHSLPPFSIMPRAL